MAKRPMKFFVCASVTEVRELEVIADRLEDVEAIVQEQLLEFSSGENQNIVANLLTDCFVDVEKVQEQD